MVLVGLMQLRNAASRTRIVRYPAFSPRLNP